MYYERKGTLNHFKDVVKKKNKQLRRKTLLGKVFQSGPRTRYCYSMKSYLSFTAPQLPML